VPRSSCPENLLLECDFAGSALASARVALQEAVQDVVGVAEAALREGASVADVSCRVGLCIPILEERCSW
jgi:hypothetical protein